MKRWLIILSIGLFVVVGCATGTKVHTPPTVIVTECPKAKLKKPPKPLFINWRMMELDAGHIFQKLPEIMHCFINFSHSLRVIL